MPTRKPDGLHVRLGELATSELRQLVDLDVCTPEGRRIRARASEVLMPPPVSWGRCHGRWEPLVWFAKHERIMSKDELSAALARYRTDLAAVRESTPAPRTAA